LYRGLTADLNRDRYRRELNLILRARARARAATTSSQNDSRPPTWRGDIKGGNPASAAARSSDGPDSENHARKTTDRRPRDGRALI